MKMSFEGSIADFLGVLAKSNFVQHLFRNSSIMVRAKKILHNDLCL